MLPLRINRLYTAALARPSQVAPAQPPPALGDSPALELMKTVMPERDRRVVADRRMQDRREKDQSLMLDTRTGQTRRRTPGRRAQDQNKRDIYLAISVKA